MMENGKYESKPQTVSVAIGTSMYSRFSALANTPSHVLADLWTMLCNHIETISLS